MRKRLAAQFFLAAAGCRRLENAMKDLPLAAKTYLFSLWAIAALLLALTLLTRDLTVTALPFLVLALLGYVLADYFEIEFDMGDGRPVAMSLADVPTLFLVAVSGPTGMLAIFGGTLIVDVLRKREWYKSLFNVSVRCITFLTMWQAYILIALPGEQRFEGLRGLAALAVAAAVYITLNTLLVSTIIALAGRQPLLRVYQGAFRTVNWVHLISLPLAAVLAVIWHVNPWLVLPGIMPLFMAHRSFKALAAWQQESRRSKQLASESRQLAGKLERLQDTTTAMIASLDPLRMLDTVSSHLAALLDAPASWVVLLDAPARLVAARGIEPGSAWDAEAYAASLKDRAVQRFAAHDIIRMHGAAAPWQSLVIIPLAVEDRVLGGICVAAAEPIALAEDDERVLLAFGAQAALAMEHARLFEELRLKQDELVRSSKLAALGTFSAGIAHEFNNLLAGILGHAELGLLSDDIAEKNDSLTVAVKTCLRGKSITRGLLTFARRNDGQRDLNQIRDAVEETLALVERELAKANVRVERRLEPVSPTVCDLGQISQVLLNLITNARDAMLDGGGGVITIELAQRGKWIELAVSDTGSGIPERMLSQIFQPFVTTKGALGGSTVPGTGLGLAISYGIIESHGGSIIPRSEPGRGTTMTVRLPIVSQPALTEQEAAGSALPPLRILIVDDEESVVRPVIRLLETRGHTVAFAADGAVGLQMYRERRFDLVMSDVVMPSMGGAEFVRRLRALDASAQILVVTGQASSSQADEMRKSGAFGVVSKPFVIEELLNVIARGMNARVLATA
jgi:two-component system NtrC family sensor kinase